MTDKKKEAERLERLRSHPTVPRRLTLGKCKQCGEQVVVSMQKGVPIAAYENEEFCSAACCKDFHGVEHYTPGPAPPKGYLSP